MVYDALVVGGGPAGSTCARVLKRAGWNVVVVDRAAFPRNKVCAGWVTPGVFDLLELDPADYRAAGLTIQDIRGFRTTVMGSNPVDRTTPRLESTRDPGLTTIDTRYPRVVSYAIRRFEFDHFLLQRADVQVRAGAALTALERRNGTWVANGTISAPVVVGAGGHFCPVARRLRGAHDRVRPVVAKEAEFEVETDDSDVAGDMPELFFCRDLEGYGWVVRKGAYLNIGQIGRAHV